MGEDDKRQNDKTTKTTNDKMTKRQNDKKTKTLLLRAPLVAIGAQKAQVYAGCFWVLLGNLKTNVLNHLKI